MLSGALCRTTPSIYWPVSSISMYNSYARKQWYDETLRPSDLVLPYAHPAAATEGTLAEEVRATAIPHLDLTNGLLHNFHRQPTDTSSLL